MPQCQYCHAINKANSDKCCRCGKNFEKRLASEVVIPDANSTENKGREQIAKIEESSALVHFSAEPPEF